MPMLICPALNSIDILENCFYKPKTHVFLHSGNAFGEVRQQEM